jgi:hypothetical protein
MRVIEELTKCFMHSFSTRSNKKKRNFAFSLNESKKRNDSSTKKRNVDITSRHLVSMEFDSILIYIDTFRYYKQVLSAQY